MSGTLEEAIARIQELLATDAPIDLFMPVVRNLAQLTKFNHAARLPAGTRLYRATGHHRDLPPTVSDLSFPPAAKVLEYGRANRPGAPVFYCTSHPNPALAEIGARRDRFVAISTWVTCAPIIVPYLGFSPPSLARLGGERALAETLVKFRETLTSEQINAHDFLAAAFTRNDKSAYPLTAAIMEVFSAGDDLAGVIYPAVARGGRADNLALLPAFVTKCLRLERAQLVLIDDTGADESFGYSPIADLRSIGADGALEWLYRSQTDPVVPPQSSTSVWLGRGERRTVRGEGDALISAGNRVYRAPPGSSIEDVDGDLRVTGPDGKQIDPEQIELPMSFDVAPLVIPAERARQENSRLKSFKTVMAIAVRSRSIGSESVNVAAACVVTNLNLDENPWTAQLADQDALEFRNPTISPEQIGWWKFIEIAQRSTLPGPVAVIVEGDLGMIAQLNARQMALADSFPLPKKFTLHFAATGAERSNYVASEAVRRCNTVADGVLDRLVQNPSLGAKQTDSPMYSAFQVWKRSNS